MYLLAKIDARKLKLFATKETQANTPRHFKCAGASAALAGDSIVN